MPLSLSFTAAQSVDFSTYTVLPPANGDGRTNQPDRVIDISASTPQSSGTAILRLAVCDSNPFTRVIKAFDFALTINALRAGTDGASGNYLVTVASSRTGGSGTDREDLSGFQREKGYQWRLGLVSSTFTVDAANPLTVDVMFDTEV